MARRIAWITISLLTIIIIGCGGIIKKAYAWSDEIHAYFISQVIKSLPNNNEHLLAFDPKKYAHHQDNAENDWQVFSNGNPSWLALWGDLLKNYNEAKVAGNHKQEFYFLSQFVNWTADWQDPGIYKKDLMDHCYYQHESLADYWDLISEQKLQNGYHYFPYPVDVDSLAHQPLFFSWNAHEMAKYYCQVFPHTGKNPGNFRKELFHDMEYFWQETIAVSADWLITRINNSH